MFRDIARLFANPLRVKLVKLFTLQEMSRFGAGAVAMTVGASKERVERELKSLVRAGIVTQRTQGKGNVYAVNVAHPLLPLLQAFLEPATLPSDRSLAHALGKVRGLSLAVASGILAGETRGSVDLLIVTSRPDDPSVAAAVRRVERLVALPLRYAVLPPRDYTERYTAHDRLLRDIFEFSHRILVGRP